MTTIELNKSLNLTTINEVYDKEITGVFISDMLSNIMNGANAGNILVTVQTHKNVIAAANLVDISCIIIIQGKTPDKEVIEMANKAQIALLSTKDDGWKIAQKLYECGIR